MKIKKENDPSEALEGNCFFPLSKLYAQSYKDIFRCLYIVLMHSTVHADSC